MAESMYLPIGAYMKSHQTQVHWEYAAFYVYIPFCTICVCLPSVQRIDMERASREAMDPALRHKPRLIIDDELPSWLLRDEEEVSEVRQG